MDIEWVDGFKIQVGACLFHLALPLVNQLVAFAFQHQARTFYIAGVILLRNQPGAGGATTSDMVIQAGAYWVLGRQLHGTFANAEKPCRNVKYWRPSFLTERDSESLGNGSFTENAR